MPVALLCSLSMRAMPSTCPDARPTSAMRSGCSVFILLVCCVPAFGPKARSPSCEHTCVSASVCSSKVYRSGYVIVGSSLCALAAFLGVESRSSRLGGGLTDFPYFEIPAMSQNAPSDAGELIGERDRQHVGMQPLLGRLDPGFEPVALPAFGLVQHNPRRLHEQYAQIAIAALGYPAQDRAAPGRHLSRHETQPCAEVAAFGEDFSNADSGHRRAGDERSEG